MRKIILVSVIAAVAIMAAGLLPTMTIADNQRLVEGPVPATQIDVRAMMTQANDLPIAEVDDPI